MVYDVSSMESYHHVDDWLNEVDRFALSTTVKLLIGNKGDLVDQREIKEEDAQKYADKMGFQFLETSAKNATNVEAAFLLIARQLMNNKEKDMSSSKDTKENKDAKKSVTVDGGAASSDSSSTPSKCCN
jgi:GTPase SAR1 family protein